MYDYGNTRLRATKSRLLSSGEIESLANSGTVEGLIAALLKTRYRHPLEQALARTEGVRAVNLGTRLALTTLVDRLRDYYEGRARQGIDLMLRRYDVDNVKSILRGLDNRLPTREITQAFAAFGALDKDILSQIARADQPREAIDIMASMGLSIAGPLMVHRTKHPGATLFELELALERWYFQNTVQETRSPKEDEKALLDALTLSADLNNLMTVLRFAHTPAQRQYLADARNMELTDLLLEYGNLSTTLLLSAGEQDSVAEAVQLLENSPYGNVLAAGLEHYQQTGRLSAIERALRQNRLAWMKKQIIMNPLGIAVPLGVFALKANEASNLRWIAWGLQMGMTAREIRQDLEFPS